MKVYTKTGDDGQTSLLSKQRVGKDHIRVHAYGTVDEANAAMGLARSFMADKPWASEIVYGLQQELILLNADLATEGSREDTTLRITADHVRKLEETIDLLDQRRIRQAHFVTPGATSCSAALDLARTIVRRSERYVVQISRAAVVPKSVALYLNRLSDLLFVLARCVEQQDLIAAVTNGVIKELGGSRQADKGVEGQMRVLDKVKHVIAAAEQKAVEIGVPMVIAVVDDGGNLIAQHRMDDALLASISLALDKAYTAVALKTATEQAALAVNPGQELYGLNTANGGRFIVFGGGIPIFVNDKIIAAIGVSGGTVEEDIIVAKAGLAAW
jgi:ATP:cob(I)alamin adenosyltransferase